MLPLLIKMMLEDSLIKLKSQAVSCCINFVRGLINCDSEEAELSEADIERNKNIVLGYSEELVLAISSLFQLSVEQKYTPLQEETLALLSCLAEVMSD